MKRPTPVDTYAFGDDEDDVPKKGGHSLRKRARVDYTFEHIDDEVIVPNSSSSARGKKRKSDVTFDTDDMAQDAKRRGTSMGADTPSARRRNPSRKSSEMKAYREAALEEDDNDVQDTIEVGVSYSDVDESELPPGNWSNPSSPVNAKVTPKVNLVAPQPENTLKVPGTETTTRPIIKLRQRSVSDFFTKASKEPLEKPVSEPSEESPEKPTKTEPEDDMAPSESSPKRLPVNGSATPTVVEQVATPIQQLVVESSPRSPKHLANGKSTPASKDTAPEQPESTSEATIDNDTKMTINETKPNHDFKEIGQVTESDEVKDANPVVKIEVQADTAVEAETVNGTRQSLPQLPLNEKADIDPIEELAQETEVAEPVVSEPIAEPMVEPTVDAVVETIIELTDKATIEPSFKSIVEQEQKRSEPEIPKAASPEPISDVPQPSIANAHSTSPSPEPKEGAYSEREHTPPANGQQAPDSPRSPHSTMEHANNVSNSDAPEPLSTPTEVDMPTPATPVESQTSVPSSHPEPKSSPQKATSPEPQPQMAPEKLQPAPVGRWAHLTPYEADYVMYPEKKGRLDEDTAAEEPTPDREGLDMEPMVEDTEDNADLAPPDAPTPAINTPTRGSPVPDSADPTTFNSPVPVGDDGDDGDDPESQDSVEKEKYFRYRRIRDPEQFLSALENYENMTTEELHDVLEAINVSLNEWQGEWNALGKVVDDYENSLRRRAADSKYEARTRNLHQHGINYEEPDFTIKGYKAREKELMSETRYLQGQDRIMAATYGFEYDPHPSKIGRQNPAMQQSGIMTRGRSLRNQPRQTAKATETEEVVGKRQRKPVTLFDPAVQDAASRSSTPVPTRGRRRKGVNVDGEETQSNPATSFNTDIVSDGEAVAPKTRRRRNRAKAGVPSIVEEIVQDQDADESAVASEEPSKPTRRNRGRANVRYEEADPNEFVEEEPQPEPEPKPVRRHLLTLKIPKGKMSESTSSITDNGDSRPSTASSEESSHTAESSYSFRPKRQKRFRDDPDATDEGSQAPPKKRGKRTKTSAPEIPVAAPAAPTPELIQPPPARKVHKIKVVRSEARNNGTATPPVPPVAATEDAGEEAPKDYKSMTKSEKMSASMKSMSHFHPILLNASANIP